jgi:hypothetical protein
MGIPEAGKFQNHFWECDHFGYLHRKGKGKDHPITGNEGSEREKYSSTLSLTSALDWVDGQRHSSAASRPGKTRYSLYRRMVVLQERSERVRKISPPPGFDLRTVQSLVTRYTDWAIPAQQSLYRLSYPGPTVAIPTELSRPNSRYTDWAIPAQQSLYRLSYPGPTVAIQTELSRPTGRTWESINCRTFTIKEINKNSRNKWKILEICAKLLKFLIPEGNKEEKVDISTYWYKDSLSFTPNFYQGNCKKQRNFHATMFVQNIFRLELFSLS